MFDCVYSTKFEIANSTRYLVGFGQILKNKSFNLKKIFLNSFIKLNPIQLTRNQVELNYINCVSSFIYLFC